MILSDAPNCGGTYDCHSDDARGIIYDLKMFMEQVVGVVSTVMTNDVPY
jgi:hypothetical protein